jgi:prepilin-type N-terminal cleavage/methylation domain-containing protein
MKNHKKFRAFTLIEVVVSVIVLGIIVTAIPALLTTTSNSISEGLKQESFTNAFATISLVSTQNWDENSTKDDNYYKVLTVLGGDSELDCSQSNGRIGKIQINNGEGRICSSDTSSHIGVDSATEDITKAETLNDIDDFNDYNVSNLDKYEINVSVSYVDDSTNYASNNINFNLSSSDTSSNIKLIEVNVYDKIGGKVAKLEYFAPNIGLSSISKRDF